MHKIRRILVAVKDPKAATPPAVSKAAQLASSLGAQLQLFHALTGKIYADAYGICDQSPEQMEQELREQAITSLEQTAAPLRAAGLKVTTAAEWDFPAYESILRQARRWHAQLIVAETHAGPRVSPSILHLTDWELLRLSAVPVLLIKNARPYRKPAVLAAVDPGHTYAKPSGLDKEILGAAAAVSTALGGVLHAVHAYLPLPLGLLEADPQTMQQMSADASSTARARLRSILQATPVPLPNQHLALSLPEEAIRDVASATGSAIVAMGAVSRSGLKRLFIGNTAERVLDTLDCDVLIVKPKGFAKNIASRTRGPRRGVIGPMLPV